MPAAEHGICNRRPVRERFVVKKNAIMRIDFALNRSGIGTAAAAGDCDSRRFDREPDADPLYNPGDLSLSRPLPAQVRESEDERPEVTPTKSQLERTS